MSPVRPQVKQTKATHTARLSSPSLEHFQSRTSSVTISGTTCFVKLTVNALDDLLEHSGCVPSRWKTVQPNVVQYLGDIVQETSPFVSNYRVIFDIAPAVLNQIQLTLEEIPDAIEKLIQTRRQAVSRQFSTHMRDSFQMLGIGLAFMLICMLIRTHLPVSDQAVTLTSSIMEGLLVVGWVALWKPLEELLFNWWPIKREEKLLLILEKINIEARLQSSQRSARVERFIAHDQKSAKESNSHRVISKDK